MVGILYELENKIDMAYSKKQIEDILSQIFDRIAEGESLRSVLSDSDMPDKNTFYRWLDEKESDDKAVKELKKKRREQYARATSERSDAIFEEIMDIADSREHDVYTDKDGKEHTNHHVIQRDRLRVDSRKWMLGKLNPKKYGDKLDLTTDGEPINIPVMQWVKPKQESE